MQILEQVRKSMRISHTALDDLHNTDIYAAAQELYRVGVNPYQKDESGEYLTDEEGQRLIKDEPLIKKAIELYAKGMEDFEEKGERYMKSFELLRDSLSLSGEYNEK